jgi:hypothetical protein
MTQRFLLSVALFEKSESLWVCPTNGDFFFFLILNLLHYYQAKNISNTKKFIISYPWWEIWMGRRVFEIKSKKVVKEQTNKNH